MLFTLFRSTCFGHHCVHHQELLSCTCSLWSRVVLGSLCPPVLLCCNTETNPTEPKLKTKQHKTNTEVKKRFIRVTQIICSNYKMYIMTYFVNNMYSYN